MLRDRSRQGKSAPLGDLHDAGLPPCGHGLARLLQAGKRFLQVLPRQAGYNPDLHLEVVGESARAVLSHGVTTKRQGQ